MMMEENIDQAESIIRKWDLNADNLEKYSILFVEDRKEAKMLLETTISLHKAMQCYVQESTPSEILLVQAQKLIQMAMKRLEKEFYTILSANRKNLDFESVSNRSSRARSSISSFFEDDVSIASPCTPITPQTDERALDMAMSDLKSIADCMIACGYGKECINNYKTIRKSIVDETLELMGIEILHHHQLKKMEWTVLDEKIKRWVHALKVSIKTLFSGEKILCEIVFSSSEKTAETCFNEISKDAAMNLLKLPSKFGKCKKNLSSEKMFRTLDMYEAISDLWPEIESIFSSEALAPVRSEALEVLEKLGEAVRIMLGQFEAAIQKDSSKSPPCGGIHPLTHYVMNYLVSLSDYGTVISDVVEDWPIITQTSTKGSRHFSSTKSYEKGICGQLAWLFLGFLRKLDSKAMQYSHMELSYLFLMNNLHYVVSKVRSSNLGLLMGSDWIREHESKVNEFIDQYENTGWKKVISSLPEDPSAEIPLQQAKQCFKQFSSGFHEAYKKQNLWVIPDPKLRDEVRVSLAKKIALNYQVFYQKHMERYTRELTESDSSVVIRYFPQELVNYMSDMFYDASSQTNIKTPCNKKSSYRWYFNLGSH